MHYMGVARSLDMNYILLLRIVGTKGKDHASTQGL